jgi:hypothetical protein
MTRSLPFTELGLRRAIAAARKSGLEVTGIRPDGTLMVHEPKEGIIGPLPVEEKQVAAKWEDVEA